MKGKFDKKIRAILVKAGVLTEQKADEALELAEKEEDKSYSDVLLEKGYVSESDYLSALSAETRLPPIDVEKVEPDEHAVSVLSQELAQYYCVLPVSRINNLLTVAVSNPFDLPRFDELGVVTNCEIRPVLGVERAIRKAIQRAYNPEESKMAEILERADEEIGGGNGASIELKENPEKALEEEIDLTKELADSGEGSPVIKLVNMVIIQALKERASDIHIEPFEKYTRVRLRIDGALRETVSPPKSMHPAIATRIKVLAGMNVAERRIPQDGKMQVKYEGRQVDIRCSVLPTVHGEKIVMRLLDSSNLNMTIDQLGFEKEAEARFRKAISASYGMVLVTGPTGSGKSSTLYAALKEMMNPEENVVTVEDPVEYQLEGINQVPVNPKRGLTFAAALRSILRQDPDIVMVGEIRDLETADIAVKAALTGHLVLSTLHTNDAASSLTRLVDMGVDRFMVASSLILASAQRLCRRLCAKCRRPMNPLPPEDYLLSIGFKPEELKDLVLYEPVGCPACNNGYRGRFAILEALEVDDTIRQMIIQGKSSIEIKRYAIQQTGMYTLRRCAILNAIRGKTSLAEVLNMTMPDQV